MRLRRRRWRQSLGGGGGGGLLLPDGAIIASSLALVGLLAIALATAVRFDDHLLPANHNQSIAVPSKSKSKSISEPPSDSNKIANLETRISPELEDNRSQDNLTMLQEPGDLLAVETATTRILTIGHRQPPPYATIHTNSTTSLQLSNNKLNRTLANNTGSAVQNNLQSPLRLYRLSQSAQATPIFLRQPASGQDLRLYLYPNPTTPFISSQHNSSLVGLKVTPPITSNNVSSSAQVQQQHQANEQQLNFTQQEQINQNKSFPSLAVHTNLEDEFERQLATGHYQRIAPTASTNMSWTQLLRQASLDNVMESLMVTNRSMVSLVCDTDDMLLRLKFKQPFRGLVVTKLDRFRACRLMGTGAHYYEWRIPLNSCGTRQEQPRLFINNIQIQFHHQEQLDTADDEVKTIVCSYPLKPRAPVPLDPVLPNFKKGLSERIIEEPTTAEPPVRLVHYEPLVLISGLLLLALTLLGLAAGAYLVIRRQRHRRLRSLSSSSNISSRLYRPPPQLAHLHMAPPLISISKTGKPRPRPVHPIDDAQHFRTGTISMEPKPATNHKSKAPSSDSLATDRSSVTTIEIPFLKPKEEENNMEEDKKGATNDSRKQDTSQQDEKKSPSATPLPVKKPKRNALVREREVQVDNGPPRFGSLRATLTSPNEFRRLQDIERLFDEILIEEHVDKGNDKTLIFKTTRLSPSKYKSKILDQMDEMDRRQVSKLIGQDELFRSLVVESTDLETFRRKLRNSPIYKDLLKPSTWNLLEEILLDSDLTTLQTSSESVSHQREMMDQKNNQQELVHFDDPKAESVLAQREILSPPSTKLPKIDDNTVNHHHQTSRPSSSPTNHYRDDSLEDQSTSKRPKLEVSSRAKQEQEHEMDGKGESKVKRSVVKVRQINSTRTITNGGSDGFGSTMINMDSVTNFSTSSSSKEGFSTFTRSSIEHNRYHAREIDNSSEDGDAGNDQRL